MLSLPAMITQAASPSCASEITTTFTAPVSHDCCSTFHHHLPRAPPCLSFGPPVSKQRQPSLTLTVPNPTGTPHVQLPPRPPNSLFPNIKRFVPPALSCSPLACLSCSGHTKLQGTKRKTKQKKNPPQNFRNTRPLKSAVKN